MNIATHLGEVKIVNEPAYTFGSADNVHSYLVAKNLNSASGPVSVHGVFLNEEPLLVVGASGGATGIHEHSALWLSERLYLAVCDTVVCMRLQPFEFLWSLRVDGATCFGIHFHTETSSLLSHGELEITRFTESGTVLWQSSGRDIFTGSFTLGTEFIEAEDFYGHQHLFHYLTGKDAA